jgi:hypothetical protein
MNEQTPTENPSTPPVSSSNVPLSGKSTLLPASLTTVTPLSKVLAAVVVIALPFVGFLVGIGFGQNSAVPQPSIEVSRQFTKQNDVPVVEQPSETATTSTPTSTVPVVPPAVGGNPGTPPTTGTPPVTATNCGITNCHGFDITCGDVSEPIACTMIYMVGDACRQFASCGVVNGTCQPVVSKKFNDCKTCVETCETKNKNNPVGASTCEDTCLGR